MTEDRLLVSATKDPTKVRAGTIGARARWGAEPVVVRLDDLTPPQRRLVLAMVAAVREESERDQPEPIPA